jgi:elongation factor 1-beta
MARVVASIKIFPAEPGANLEDLKGEIKRALPEGIEVYKMEEEPIAFGLVALVGHFVLPGDSGGLMEKLEEGLKSTPGVGEIQFISARRV